MSFKCQRCEADPQPENFGSPRNCAFDEQGVFTSDNWNCATLDALLAHQQGDEHYGEDEHMEVVSVRVRWTDENGYDESGTDGWIVTARYKHRGCTSNAAHVTQRGTHPLTLKLVEDVIAAYEQSATGAER